jgi:4-hydroxy-3-methylbut-2-en-1-yl diphosphate synthase IspG/GcpE
MEIVRVAILSEQDAKAIKEIKKGNFRDTIKSLTF